MKSAGFTVRNAENEKPDNTESLEKEECKKRKGQRGTEAKKETQFGKFNKMTNKWKGDKKSSGGGRKEGNEVRNEKRRVKGQKGREQVDQRRITSDKC